LAKGLIEAAETKKSIRQNSDGSSFVFISAEQLDAAGALVARSKRSPRDRECVLISSSGADTKDNSRSDA
jgi:hypothetical protein